MNLTPDKILHPVPTEGMIRNGYTVLIDRDGPNWLVTDTRGASLLSKFDGRRRLTDIVNGYAEESGFEWSKAFNHVETIARDAVRQGLLTDVPVERAPYTGRGACLDGAGLEELWIHTNNSCNLACSHCLVSSSPQGDRGLDTRTLAGLIREARSLGVNRFYFTGGEPLLRSDFEELAGLILEDDQAELAVLTNGILLREARLEMLKRLDPERLRLQISLDGATAKTNDAIRGPGSFEKIKAGIRAAIEAGFPVTVTTAITAANAGEVPEVTRLVGELGGTRHHLLWLHKRGRADGDGPDATPEVSTIIDVVRRAIAAGREVGVLIDNSEALRARINSPKGVKRDLSNACVTSLCVYSDGSVYPSAATANVPELKLGSILKQDLAGIYAGSEVAKAFRAASVEDKEICRICPLKFLCGGGDVEHSYFHGGSITAHDPYCELHRAMIGDVMEDLAGERKAVLTNGKSGFNAPVAFTAMGEGAENCASGEVPPAVATSHSECVLSFDLDAPRELVREFYAQAAEEPDAELCCPISPNPDDIAHIPSEVISRFYGCGSPVGRAEIVPGETTLDLGSGAGIDVFTAAKKVGPEGRAIGVDMTDSMLEVARGAQPIVAANLGFDVVEFRKGFLEEIPLEDRSVDLVTSNCVLNLSPDKLRVFSEMWRVLANHGRMVVSDIVSAEEVPAHQRRDPRLWGECISGALTEEEFLAYLERAGFYGLSVLGKTFWKEVEGHAFWSVTVRGYKFEKREGCVFIGQRAIYTGPFKGVTDEEGHFFPRGVAVEICTDTEAKLRKLPYQGMFVLTEADGSEPSSYSCCDPQGECC